MLVSKTREGRKFFQGFESLTLLQMYIETQIKTRASKDVKWCPEVDTDYIRVLHAGFIADGRLINVVHQLSTDKLQHTRTMIFSDKPARDAYFGDPIVAVLETRTTDHDSANQIQLRTVVDG